MAGDPQVSARLIQILRTYRHGLHDRSLADLLESLVAGGFPWLRRNSRTRSAVEEEQCVVWAAPFPGECSRPRYRSAAVEEADVEALELRRS